MLATNSVSLRAKRRNLFAFSRSCKRHEIASSRKQRAPRNDTDMSLEAINLMLRM